MPISTASGTKGSVKLRKEYESELRKENGDCQRSRTIPNRHICNSNRKGEEKVTTHHAQTAMRYLDEIDNHKYDLEGTSALVHAQLETAEQLERLANMAERAMVSVEAMKKTVSDGADSVAAYFAPNGKADAFIKFIASRFGIDL